MALESWPVERLVPYDRNARTHSEAQIQQIARSIREFGFTNPILADPKGRIIAGHGRLLAAKRVGLVEVPVIVLGHLSDAQRRALVIADNQIALNAGWDEALLTEELRALEGEEFDLSVVGFSEDELADLLEPEAQPEKNEIPRVPARPATRPGDLYVLGRHRMLCADATEAASWQRVLDGARAAVCLTDPPYGLGVEYDAFNDSAENVVAIAERWLPLAKEFAACVVFTPGVTGCWLYPRPDWVLCWYIAAGASRSPWGWNCWQPLLAYGPDPSLATGNGGRPDALNVNGAPPTREIGHPCPKPLPLWRALIERLSFDRADVFVDCFGGSGTTLLACEQTNRAARLIELSPAYCDVAVQRWENETGKAAVLDGDGRSFAEVRAAREGGGA